MLTLLLWCTGLATPSLAAPAAAWGAAHLGTPSAEQPPPAAAAEEAGRAEGQHGGLPTQMSLAATEIQVGRPQQVLACEAYMCLPYQQPLVCDDRCSACSLSYAQAVLLCQKQPTMTNGIMHTHANPQRPSRRTPAAHCARCTVQQQSSRASQSEKLQRLLGSLSSTFAQRGASLSGLAASTPAPTGLSRGDHVRGSLAMMPPASQQAFLKALLKSIGKDRISGAQLLLGEAVLVMHVDSQPDATTVILRVRLSHAAYAAMPLLIPCPPVPYHCTAHSVLHAVNF